MGSARFHWAVVRGRFCPPSNDDVRRVRRALDAAERVVVLIESARQPRTLRVPWPVEERAEMLKHALGKHAERIVFRGLRDFWYEPAGDARAVQAAVADAIGETAQEVRIGIVVAKGASARTHRFPQWQPLPIGPRAPREPSALLAALFSGARGAVAEVALHVPRAVAERLAAFAKTPEFARLQADAALIRKGNEPFARLAYPPVFTTVDVVVIHSAHLLLIQRGGELGRGLWALPGGFLDGHERLAEAAIRELREETRVDLSDDALLGARRGHAAFDHPERSLRGRTITHAFHFDLPSGPLPRVRGADDAQDARWVPLAELDAFEESMFDDHFQIVRYFLGAGR